MALVMGPFFRRIASLKDKIEELVLVGYLAQFIKKFDDNKLEANIDRINKDHRRRRDTNRRRD